MMPENSGAEEIMTLEQASKILERATPTFQVKSEPWQTTRDIAEQIGDTVNFVNELIRTHGNSFQEAKVMRNSYKVSKSEATIVLALAWEARQEEFRRTLKSS